MKESDQQEEGERDQKTDDGLEQYCCREEWATECGVEPEVLGNVALESATGFRKADRHQCLQSAFSSEPVRILF